MGKLRKGSRTGQRKKLSSVAGLAKALADCMGALQLETGQAGQAVYSHISPPLNVSHPWNEHDLGGGIFL